MREIVKKDRQLQLVLERRIMRKERRRAPFDMNPSKTLKEADGRTAGSSLRRRGSAIEARFRFNFGEDDEILTGTVQC